MIELAVREMGDRLSIIAGAGSNDTRHAVHLTERCDRGRRRRDPVGHAVLQQAQPPRDRAPLRGGGEGHRQAGPPLQHPRRAPGTNMPPDLLAELAQIEHIDGRQAGQRRRAAADRRPRRLRRQRRHAGSRARSGRSRAASSWPATSWATRCAAWSTSPSNRAEIDASLRDVYETLFITANPTCTKAALNMLGHDVGRPAAAARRGDRGRGAPRCARCSSATGCSTVARHVSNVASCASCRSAGWARSART